jgi:hypothetical protein
MAGKSQIPHFAKEIELLDIDVPGTFEEEEPNTEELATIQDSDFGKATEGEGDPAEKKQQTPQPDENKTSSPSPQESKKEMSVSDSKLEENREVIRAAYDLLTRQGKIEIIRQVFPDEPQRSKIGKWDSMPNYTIIKIYNILHSSPIWEKAKEIIAQKKESPATKKETDSSSQGDSPQTIRDRVKAWMKDNAALHGRLSEKLTLVFPECQNIHGYLVLENLAVPEWVSDLDIKKIDETIRTL